MICKEHADAMVAEDLITDEGWAIIERGFHSKGLAVPKRELTVLEWEPLEN